MTSVKWPRQASCNTTWNLTAGFYPIDILGKQEQALSDRVIADARLFRRGRKSIR